MYMEIGKLRVRVSGGGTPTLSNPGLAARGRCCALCQRAGARVWVWGVVCVLRAVRSSDAAPQCARARTAVLTLTLTLTLAGEG